MRAYEFSPKWRRKQRKRMRAEEQRWAAQSGPVVSYTLGEPCTCTIACIPEGRGDDQFCRERESCADA